MIIFKPSVENGIDLVERILGADLTRKEEALIAELCMEFSEEEFTKAVLIGARQYLIYTRDDIATQRSSDTFFTRLYGILKNRREGKR